MNLKLAVNWDVQNCFDCLLAINITVLFMIIHLLFSYIRLLFFVVEFTVTLLFFAVHLHSMNSVDGVSSPTVK